MRSLFAILLMLAVGATVTPVRAHDDHGPSTTAKRGLCRVCHVKEGTTEEEVVKAVRTYAGVEYGFCSEHCAKEFDADPAAYVPAAYPAPAPPLPARTLDGKPLAWDGYRDQLVLVDFWATWCAPCRVSMPELQTLHDRYRDRGFRVLGISIDEGGPSKVKKYVAKAKLTYPMALDSEKDPAWEAFRVKAIPAAFLVDGKGAIVASWLGKVDPAEIEREVLARLPRAD
jgi:peroxiredoxin/YHS domain-containing protein